MIEEQAQRGTIYLIGFRNGQPMEVEVPNTHWDAKTRPVMNLADSELFRRATDLLEADRIEEGLVLFDQLNADPFWKNYQLGRLFFGKRAVDRAAYHFQSAKANPKVLGRIYSILELGRNARRARRVEESLEFFLEALQLVNATYGDCLLKIRPLNLLTNTYWRFPRMALAELAIERALSLNQRFAPDSLAHANSWNEAGLLLLEQEDFEAAREHFSCSLRIQEGLGLESLLMSHTISNLCIIYIRLGHWEKAEQLGQRGLAIRLHLSPNSTAVAASLNNLGIVSQELGKFAEAEEYFLRAAEIRESASPGSLSLAGIYHQLASLSFQRELFKKAVAYEEQALGIAHQWPDSQHLGRMLTAMGMIYHKMDDLVSAESYYKQALDIQGKRVERGMTNALYLYRLARVCSDAGKLDEAEHYYRKAYAIVEPLIRVRNSPGIKFIYNLYRNYAATLLEMGNQEVAFDILERLRARKLLQEMAEKELFIREVPTEVFEEQEALGARYNRLQALAWQTKPRPRDEQFQMESLQQQLRDIRIRLADLRAQVIEASPRYADLRYPTPLRMTEARKILTPGSLLLSYLVTEKKSYLVALGHDGFKQTVTIPIGEEELERRVQFLRNGLTRPQSGSLVARQALDQLCTDWYRDLIEPIDEALVQARRLIIIPDGPLWQLPFGALAKSEDGSLKRIGGWKPFSIAGSATLYAYLQANKQTRSGLEIALFGDPIYGQTQNGADERGPAIHLTGDVRSLQAGLTRLEASGDEVRGIAQLYQKKRLFLREEANEQAFKSLDSKVGIIHLAVHGGFDSQHDTDSWLALSAPEDSSLSGEDGVLQAWEIFAGQHLEADLVVLSACDTIGENEGGEGLQGLVRAFQYAGARTVLANLWQVSDEASAVFMTRFHKHLKSGLSKDEALCSTQRFFQKEPIQTVNRGLSRWWSQKVEHDASHPFYWAGFQLIGPWD